MKAVAAPRDVVNRISRMAEIAGLNAYRQKLAMVALPVVGPLPREGRVICALGHDHVGLSAAASTSRVVAEIVANNDTSNEWNALLHRAFSLT